MLIYEFNSGKIRCISKLSSQAMWLGVIVSTFVFENYHLSKKWNSSSSDLVAAEFSCSKLTSEERMPEGVEKLRLTTEQC